MIRTLPTAALRRTAVTHCATRPLNQLFPARTWTMAAYSSIQTPSACYADFCLIPVGTGNVSVAAEVAEVQKVLRDSGLKYTMHSAGTTVEGPWDEVMTAIGKAHAVVHERGVVRVQSSMRVGTRTDKKQTAEDKVKRVEGLLAEAEGK